MEEWWVVRAEKYYLEIVMLFSAIATFFVSFRNRHYSESLKFIYLYPAVSAIQTIFSLLLEALYYSYLIDNFEPYWSICLYTFLLVEYLSVWRYFQLETYNKIEKRIIKFSIIPYFATFSFLVFEFPFISVPMQLYKFQSFTIIFVVVIYLIDLFKSPPKDTITEKRNFWVSVAFSVMAFGMTPMLIALAFIYDEKFIAKENIGNYITCFIYILTFFSLTFAFHPIGKSDNSLST